MSQSRQLAAIMFTDIVGYTLLMGEDERKGFELLRKNRNIQRPIIEKYKGRWVKEIGDGVLASFSTVSDAVYCAKEIQETCVSEPELRLRIGIHLGEVVFEDDDVFGDGVNIASRLEPLAPVGGILVSEPVHNNLINKTDIQSTIVGEKYLKNVKEPVRVYQVQVEGVVPLATKDRSVTGKWHSSIRNPFKMAIAAAGILLMLLLTYFFYFNSADQRRDEVPAAPRDKSIVVLPFTNMSSDPAQEYFSDGMMDEILNHLAKISDLKVISRTTAMQYKGSSKSIPEITRELQVATALEGSVRKDEAQVRITVQLIDGNSDTHLWSESYDRQLNNIFEVQSDVAQQVAQVLKAEISPKVLRRIKPTPSKSLEAYNLLLEANYISRQPGSTRRQRELMEQAVALDSTNARIWAGLAMAYSRWGGDYTTRAERASKARSAAEQAILIDPEDATGRFELGRILRIFYWDWEQAAIELKMAEELSSEFVGASLSLYQTLGLWDESIEAARKLLDQNPVNPTTWRVVGHNYLLTGLPSEAIEAIKKSLELDPHYNLAWVDLAWAYLEQNQPDKALEALNKDTNQTHGRFISYLIYAYHQKGMDSEVMVYLERLIEKDEAVDNSVYIARTYALLKEADHCFEWLQKAYERKNPVLTLIKTATFNQVQNLQDPRFNELLRKMNLPN